ncbi:hypothetical protein H310_13824 [Aphanomyces invadans]|uniref:Uncharacterized protein n=1 Tax=Aphanomyces invadans TaxID=157072 RepID=A0A024TDV0_9STRA|nr:hypothetical protein H310_13824 [Aphanomyces invadans]ETV91766.1 hypothetical protein H310_13824 [Aphanomyces invadans]|eukprot:XP_008879692.1 hypothetical protein H310_13824 [Aphanomyces invadans]
MGKQLLAICCRRRFDDLLAAFKKATLKALHSSGTEEEYNELDQLLQDIVDLIDAAATKKKTLKKVQDERETDGQLIRDAALVSLKRKAVDDEVERVAPVVATFTEMMLESNKIKAEEVATKKEEIMLAQQKLELERARYELDKAEREARFAVEKKEREHRGKLYIMDAM